MKEGILLHLETATEVCSVALSQNGKLIHFEETTEPNAHSRVITRLIERCLKAAGIGINKLSGVGVSAGPGSYTGLRVGVSTAKGICYSLGIPLFAADTLLTMAWACQAELPGATYIPMIDARRMEVYLAIYDRQMNCLLPTEARVLDEHTQAELPLLDKPLVLCGNGAHKAQSLFGDAAVLSPIRCSAAHQIALIWEQFQAGAQADLVTFEPAYLKNPNITNPKEYKF
jgi:tRNA threonylcarbamoyladenosine biosynthesis protein TsaB